MSHFSASREARCLRNVVVSGLTTTVAAAAILLNYNYYGILVLSPREVEVFGSIMTSTIYDSGI